MEELNLSRQNLETMSTQDLIAIANDYGIDIPVDLNRNFIISELLDIEQEFKNNEEDTFELNDSEENIPTTLPKTYNDTKINIFLRNPVWLFTFWDIKESTINELKSSFDFEHLFIRLSFYKNENDETPEESFDVNINFESNNLYIHIPSGKHYVMANLACSFSDKPPKVLAYTKKLEIQQEAEEIRNLQPGKKMQMSELVRLSGMETLLHNHYLTHRQSFSN